ncbi:MAG: TetR/AcrR family transcriptional regulator, partial [Deltaproteobacteria bacterium]
MPRPKDVDSVEGRIRHEHKAGRILDAALVVFASKGFHDAKISEIARMAGVADGTIYLYFKNKDALLASLFETKLRSINEGLSRELQGMGDAKERLRHVIRYHLRLALEQPQLVSFVTGQLRHSSKPLQPSAQEQLAGYLSQWAKVIDDGKHEGAFRADVSTGAVQQILFGALDHACLAWVVHPGQT